MLLLHGKNRGGIPLKKINRSMILIADSGSTNTQWALADRQTIKRFSSSGMNPVHLSEQEIEDMLLRELTPVEGNVEAVYFFGAGCLPEKREPMQKILSRVFGCTDITVDSDLAGAAKALCGNKPGIACILGTGSNSCFYDGKEIAAHVPPLGFILGDEGSGAALGKKLIGNLLKGLCGKEITNAFYQEYKLNYPEIITAVYRSPQPNRFLAGFAPFIKRHLDDPHMHSLVADSFSEFVERNLLRYEEVKTLPVSFTGSIAYHFRKPLREVMDSYEMNTGEIIQAPLEKLIRYYLE